MNPAQHYILNQPEPYRSILLHISSIIESTLPEVNLKYKWRIPCYYSGQQPICYLNAVVKKGYVDVGLWNAAYLTDYHHLMVAENRKVIKSLRYSSLDDIDNTILIAVLKASYALKEKGFYRKQ